MSIRRTTVLAALLLAFLPALPLLLGGCESKPAEPVFDNVFDPEGPNLGDPLNVFTTLNDTVITVFWNQFQGYGISLYEVSHSNSYGSGYEFFASVTHTSSGSAKVEFPHPEPTTEHYFKVLALTADNDFLFLSYQKPGVMITPPKVTWGEDNGSSATRYLALSVTVASGDSLLVSDNDEFLGSLRVAVAESGSPQEIIWDLGPAEANEEERKLFVKALGAPTESTLFIDSLVVDFQPAFTIVDSPDTVATLLVDLDIPLEGILQMRFSNSAEDLASETWLAPAATLTGFELVDTLNPQVIYGEFTGDFGFTSPIMEWPVAADPLTDATFEVDLGTAPVTLDPIVILDCDAVATLMRFSEGQDFTLVPWLEYDPAPPFELSAGPGIKTIYGQFRNDFADSPVIDADVEYLLQVVAVGFLSPSPGNNITGGSSFGIIGWADAAGAPVDSVKVELGDGLGFVAVEGLEDWNLVWDVPEVEEETELLLRVRAWAAADSVTAQVSVDIFP